MCTTWTLPFTCLHDTPLGQVYDGTRAMWAEDDALAPVNAYGRSKVEAEEYIRVRAVGVYAAARPVCTHGHVCEHTAAHTEAFSDAGQEARLSWYAAERPSTPRHTSPPPLYMQAHWPAHVCLRSSLIYGPPAPGTQRPLFLQVQRQWFH
jgi:hypothetical protein